MNAERDDQTELQRVLALKRHEAPPPRFFRGFSDKVIDQLHTPEREAPRTWRQRLSFDADNKPVWVCASGIVVCGLLGVGLILSLRVERPKTAPGSLDEQSRFVVSPPVNALTTPTPATLIPAGASEIPPVGAPVMVSESSPFAPNKPQPVRATISESVAPKQGN